MKAFIFVVALIILPAVLAVSTSPSDAIHTTHEVQKRHSFVSQNSVNLTGLWVGDYDGSPNFDFVKVRFGFALLRCPLAFIVVEFSS